MKGIDAREILLAIGAFLTGLTTAYTSDKTGVNWVAWLMGGLSSLGTGIGAYAITNPRLQPTTPEQLLASVKKSELAPKVKLEVAETLAAETVKPMKEPPEPKA